MTSLPSSRRCSILLVALLLPLAGHAQIAAGKDKFLGNIISTSVPSSFGTYWNQVTPENGGKWGTVEATRDTMNWTQLDTAYNYAKANGLKFKEHTLVWGSQYPSWITGLSASEARAEVEQWMSLLAARYPDVWAIDVVNEPVKTPMPASLKAGLGGDGTTGWDWVITSFQLARAKFPNAKLFINEYGTENDASARNQMLTIIGLLKTRGLIDGIGIQAHYFNLDSMTAAQMTACLDAYAATGLDLYITELDMKGPSQTEASQSSQYQAIFPAIWTHAAVKGVTLWGYIDGQTWSSGTGIMASNGSTERAALTWLKGYVTGNTQAVPLAAPSNLSASAASSSSIGLTWTDNATSELSYRVEQATAAGGPWTEVAGALAANATTYTATGLSASTTYYFRVRASNNTGNSDYSATASAATQAAPVVTPPPSSSGGGGGGGAPSTWFLAFLGLATLGRLRQRRT